MNILLTGGTGYIGSHTAVKLLEDGHNVVIIDNLVNSSSKAIDKIEKITGKRVAFYVANLKDIDSMREVFINYEFDACIHFAGLKAVGESNEKPLDYYENNVYGTINLLRLCKEFNLKYFVFSSSATVYGDCKEVPIKETAPLSTTNPYGETKLIIEQLLRDFYKVNNCNIAILRYFNPVGAHPSGELGENPLGIPNNLMPIIMKVASKEMKELKVFGNDYDTLDGTGVRDYIHVEDLAIGHVLALNKLEKDGGLLTYNIGTGKGYSVLQIISAFEKASGVKIPYVFAPRRKGDVATCYADVTKAKNELGFVAKYDIDKMCEDSFRFNQKYPKGF